MMMIDDDDKRNLRRLKVTIIITLSSSYLPQKHFPIALVATATILEMTVVLSSKIQNRTYLFCEQNFNPSVNLMNNLIIT